MSRKKLSDMTPIERVNQRMKGMSWKKQTNPKHNRRSHSNNATFASVPISK